MADLTQAVAQSHAAAPHQTGHSRVQSIATKYDPAQPRDKDGQWVGTGLPPGYTTELENTAFYSGQSNFTIRLKKHGQQVGHADYVIFGERHDALDRKLHPHAPRDQESVWRDEITMSMIEVDSAHRRQGLGMALLRTIAKEHPGLPINSGMRTDEGGGLWQKWLKRPERLVKYDPNQPRDDQGQWSKTTGRTFTSEEGYQWHEQGPVADWARALPHPDHKELHNYGGFGYHDLNDQLRGTFKPRMVDEFVRPSSKEEYEATGFLRVEQSDEERKAYFARFGHPFGKELRNYDIADPEHRIGDIHGNYVGRVVHNIYTKDPVTGEKVEYSVQRSVPDMAYVEQLKQRATKMDDLIANRGYELPEAIVVERGAYIPGVTFAQLQDMAYPGPNGEPPPIWEEKGFTSTMVGDAERRAKSYPALAKSESLYNRFHDQMHAHEDEAGSAIRFHITLPAGTKVASIEASRRLEFEHPKIPNPAPMPTNDAFWAEHPDLWTVTEYDKVSKVTDEKLKDKSTRIESEVLLGSGARFRVLKVQHGETYPGGGGSKPVPIEDVHLEYIGGGSSEGRKRATDYLSILKFDPHQPRDTHGRFAEIQGPPATVIERLHRPDGGFTYSPTTGGQPRTGYAVSPYRTREAVLDLGGKSPEQIAHALTDFAVTNWDLLRQKGHYIGGWHHPKTGKVYLDISVITHTPERATQVALDSDQIAYFDLRRGKSVKLGKRNE